MIIHAFLRWVETAKAGDRARAASALGKAYSTAKMGADERHAAAMAMIFLLDDPAPKVRLALAEAIADNENAPRAVILPLSEDQPEIAAQIILRSNVLTDADLIDLSAKGGEVVRSLVAHRSDLSKAVCAALVEVGTVFDMVTLLTNEHAFIGKRSLKRICDRHGESAEVRALLLDREDLPSDARHALVEMIGNALISDSLVLATVGARRAETVARRACDAATVTMAAQVEGEEVNQFVDHLRVSGRLTPVFLMQALCAGRIEFFAAAIVNLSGQGERRVHSILADGRQNAVRALFETAGLGRDISVLFADAILLWRREARKGFAGASVSKQLAARARTDGGASQELLEVIEGLSLAEQRQSARSFVLQIAQDAA